MSKIPIIAVDPGMSGGFVWGDGLEDPEYASMPTTLPDIRNLILDIVDSFGRGQRPTLWLEKITGYMDDKARPSGVTQLKFGRNIGQLQMGFCMLDVPMREIAPTKWMRDAGVSTTRRKVLTPSQWKGYLKEQAQLRFPPYSAEITLKTADAFLIYYAVLSSRS